VNRWLNSDMLKDKASKALKYAEKHAIPVEMNPIDSAMREA